MRSARYRCRWPPPGTLDAQIRFYEQLQGVEADGWFASREAGLKLAMVSASSSSRATRRVSHPSG